MVECVGLVGTLFKGSRPGKRLLAIGECSDGSGLNMGALLPGLRGDCGAGMLVSRTRSGLLVRFESGVDGRIRGLLA